MISRNSSTRISGCADRDAAVWPGRRPFDELAEVPQRKKCCKNNPRRCCQHQIRTKDPGAAVLILGARLQSVHVHVHLPRPPARGDGGFPILLGGGSYRIRILKYRDVSCMYPDCILMCYVHIHQAMTSRYIEIHQDKFVSVNFGYHRKCILPRDMYPALRYIQDTFNDTKLNIQCILTLSYMTHKIHARYMSDTYIHSRIRISSLSPYLRPVDVPRVPRG